jgi:hypothetical protein
MTVALRHKCQFCSERYETERGLNIHVGRMHPNASTSSLAVPPCPECGRDDFKRNADLGRHRRFTHNIRGTSHDRKTTHALERTPQANEAGSRKIHSGANQPTLPNTEAPTPTAAETFNAVTYAIALGAVKEFCRHHAEEHGIPTRQFTRQFAELFFREARR